MRERVVKMKVFEIAGSIHIRVSALVSHTALYHRGPPVRTASHETEIRIEVDISSSHRSRYLLLLQTAR